jgi:hypothetical protein
MFPVRYELNMYILLRRNSVIKDRKRRRKGNPVPGGITEAPCFGGYKYGDLSLQVGGSLESEAVKCGHESRLTQT